MYICMQVINHQSWERMSIKNGNIFYVDGLTWFWATTYKLCNNLEPKHGVPWSGAHMSASWRRMWARGANQGLAELPGLAEPQAGPVQPIFGMTVVLLIPMMVVAVSTGGNRHKHGHMAHGGWKMLFECFIMPLVMRRAKMLLECLEHLHTPKAPHGL